ncbi:transposase, partial [Hyphomicrobiales bacterium BP6-180914]
MPGANVADVARRHGMSLGLLHHWRRLAREAAS